VRNHVECEDEFRGPGSGEGIGSVYYGLSTYRVPSDVEHAPSTCIRTFQGKTRVIAHPARGSSLNQDTDAQIATPATMESGATVPGKPDLCAIDRARRNLNGDAVRRSIGPVEGRLTSRTPARLCCGDGDAILDIVPIISRRGVRWSCSPRRMTIAKAPIIDSASALIG
jgi:hypothetical protein